MDKEVVQSRRRDSDPGSNTHRTSNNISRRTTRKRQMATAVSNLTDSTRLTCNSRTARIRLSPACSSSLLRLCRVVQQRRYLQVQGATRTRCTCCRKRQATRTMPSSPPRRSVDSADRPSAHHLLHYNMAPMLAASCPTLSWRLSRPRATRLNRPRKAGRPRPRAQRRSAVPLPSARRLT